MKVNDEYRCYQLGVEKNKQIRTCIEDVCFMTFKVSNYRVIG